MRRVASFSYFALAAILLGVSALQAQRAVCAWSSPSTRVAAEACLRELERSLQSGGLNGVERADLERAAERLRGRLREGDFHPGDRVYLRVAGESSLTDTLTVLPGPAIQLSRIGSVPLAGVLRGDLAAHLTDALSRFLRNPSVEARSLVRLSVVGEVAKPGFYAVPSETAVADVLMLAGGLTQKAKAEGMRVERGSSRLWEPAAVRAALSGGQTVDDLSLQEGDRIVVPARGGALDTILRIAAIVVPVTAVVLVSR